MKAESCSDWIPLRRALAVAACVLLACVAGCSSQSTDPETGAVAPADNSASTPAGATYDANSWQTLISPSCTEFYDGCNNCRRAPGSQVAACTRRACLTYEQPRCLGQDTDDEAHHVPFDCEGLVVTVVHGDYIVDDRQRHLRDDQIALQFSQTHEVATMTHVPSASGEKYQGSNMLFWTRGQEAILVRGDVTRNCQRMTL